MPAQIDKAKLPTAEEQELVAQLTRDVLADAAPEEIGIFESDERAWLQGTHKSATARDDMTAFGVEGIIVILTPYVIAAATAAVRYVAGVLAESADEELRPLIRGWVRRIFRHDDAAQSEASEIAALPVDVVKRVREVTLSTCLDMGLEKDDASLVSDAVAGRLVVPAT